MSGIDTSSSPLSDAPMALPWWRTPAHVIAMAGVVVAAAGQLSGTRAPTRTTAGASDAAPAVVRVEVQVPPQPPAAGPATAGVRAGSLAGRSEAEVARPRTGARHLPAATVVGAWGDPETHGRRRLLSLGGDLRWTESEADGGTRVVGTYRVLDHGRVVERRLIEGLAYGMSAAPRVDTLVIARDAAGRPLLSRLGPNSGRWTALDDDAGAALRYDHDQAALARAVRTTRPGW